MRAILERRAPTIFGDGEQSRDFTLVEDGGPREERLRSVLLRL
jgi:dTDP-D-glucose 4,6-dehydratase